MPVLGCKLLFWQGAPLEMLSSTSRTVDTETLGSTLQKDKARQKGAKPNEENDTLLENTPVYCRLLLHTR